ncbi:MAG: site-specific integrase [Limnohabitans sp.]|nr:site-specific integrase [Limnohabitans sp.]
MLPTTSSVFFLCQTLPIAFLKNWESLLRQNRFARLIEKQFTGVAPILTVKLGKPRHVPLSDGVITLLESMPRYNCDWAFPNPKTLKPYQSIYHSWHTARKAAGLSDVRIHDLRHTFASFLVNSGRTLYEVQLLLGHTQIKTTQRYSHLSQDALLDASNAVTRAVGHLFSPTLSPPQSAGFLPTAS